MIRQTRIRLTNQSLEVYVALEQQRKGSYTRFFLAQDLGSFLRYWAAEIPKPRKHLIVLWSDTLAGKSLRTMYSQGMQDVAGSLDWTVEEYEYPVIRMVQGSTLRCQDIYRMVKRSL